METRLLVARLDPGREEAFRRLVADLTTTRRREWAQSNRRLGVRRVSMWLRSGGSGTEAVIVCEGETKPQWPESLSQSQHRFDLWLGTQIDSLTSSIEEAEELADTRPRRGAWREWRRRP